MLILQNHYNYNRVEIGDSDEDDFVEDDTPSPFLRRNKKKRLIISSH